MASQGIRSAVEPGRLPREILEPGVPAVDVLAELVQKAARPSQVFRKSVEWRGRRLETAFEHAQHRGMQLVGRLGRAVRRRVKHIAAGLLRSRKGTKVVDCVRVRTPMVTEGWWTYYPRW